MAHNLATSNGKIAMMFSGVAPWHRLGTHLENPATASEAITAAGLDYEVELKQLFTGDGTFVPHRKGVIRSDNGEVLGAVGNTYVPVQNRQAFGFLDAVVADGSLRYHTAGALGKGERIWLLAKLPSQIRVKNSDDLVDKFLLLSNAHDGSSALRVYFTPIRVVCQNTLNLADNRSTGQGISILHKGNLHTKIREAQRVLGLAEEFYDEAEGTIDILASHHPSSTQVNSFFKSVIPDPIGADNARARKVRDRLTCLFETGIGQDMPDIKGTSWAAYNAVTEFVDHHRPTRSTDPLERASRRLDSSWFGSGARLKAKAWNLAFDMALSV